MVALACYFAYVMYGAIKKLESGDIGTIFAAKNEETVQASYLQKLTLCSLEIQIIHLLIYSILQSQYACIGNAIGTIQLQDGNMTELMSSPK